MTKSFEVRKAEWQRWHEANPAVWVLFERFALQAVHRGRKRLSHWLIINRIRWETAVETTGDDFKIRNDYIAFYARLWNEKHPEYAGLFETRPMIGEPIRNMELDRHEDDTDHWW